MPSPGLNPEGFEIETIPDIVTDQTQQLQLEFGQSVVKPKTWLTFMVGIVATIAGKIWEQLEVLYDAWNPDKASGVALEDLARHGHVQVVRAAIEGDRDVLRQ